MKNLLPFVATMIYCFGAFHENIARICLIAGSILMLLYLVWITLEPTFPKIPELPIIESKTKRKLKRRFR